ncbi:GAF domain-containing protein [Phaeovulum vinaykumarii]|uniref:Regulatory protein, Fis family n=1 Tax=Phaeovulum vinaykumarii TaxID=407234 RepID=A0A1N7M309_9RHOB|nr:GAF domain-containing protein [Phaeovulum vinaykumarii]SIS80467.1 regulatory protein, Fis family [Phaeovulum vinaykumarii]SOC09199.1 GAF domain-containing protein [Phaeovulum vinaykumarii]
MELKSAPPPSGGRPPRVRAGRPEHVEIVRQVAASGAASRSSFAASWRRSLLHHKLDPGHAAPPERLSQAEIRARREAAGPLLSVAGPVLDRLARAACETGCAVLLTDARGLILEERIRPADMPLFHPAGLAPGGDWSEGAEGTNGIGTALAEARSVIVWRDQHFRARNTALACMGAPVFGAQGELAGVLDVSSARADISEGLARMVALSVQDAAQRIEAELFRSVHAGARIVTAAAPAPEGMGPVLLAIDRDDLIVGASRAARRVFGIEAEALGRVPAGDLLEAATRREGLSGAQASEMARALARSGGNVSAAARELGIGRATFYRKARALGLEV